MYLRGLLLRGARGKERVGEGKGRVREKGKEGKRREEREGGEGKEGEVKGFAGPI